MHAQITHLCGFYNTGPSSFKFSSGLAGGLDYTERRTKGSRTAGRRTWKSTYCISGIVDGDGEPCPKI